MIPCRSLFGLTLVWVALAGIAPAQASDARAARPNILWIIAEDMGPHLGVYGTRELHTPHEKIAELRKEWRIPRPALFL